MTDTVIHSVTAETICEMLRVATATYYNHLADRADPARLSDRAKRDEAIRPEI